MNGEGVAAEFDAADDWVPLALRDGVVAVFAAGNHGLRNPRDLTGRTVLIGQVRYTVKGVELYAIECDDWRSFPVGLLVERQLETHSPAAVAMTRTPSELGPSGPWWL